MLNYNCRVQNSSSLLVLIDRLPNQQDTGITGL